MSSSNSLPFSEIKFARAWISRFSTLLVCLFIIISCQVDFSLALSTEKRLSPRIVTTKYGAVRGFVLSLAARSLQPLEVFLGVPYASPPVGKLRFMPPVTSAYWTGVKNALTPGPVCPQKPPDLLMSRNSSDATASKHRVSKARVDLLRRMASKLQNQSEDCLYLNIYAPAVVAKKSNRLPVMMFIHGESYDWNAGSNYDGSVLSSFGNVIVVTINYRLGVLGFFPALDGSSLGNFGLMDQVAALHWIQENIPEFGGDPSNVTIFGQGQGAAFVNILMLAPMAKGLFHRAIMSSGSVLSPWAVASDAVDYSKKLAAALGCPNEAQRNALMLYCLRQKSAEELVAVSFEVPSHLASFGPTVDGMVIPNEPSLLMGDLPSLYGNYDLMFGVTQAEGYNGISHMEKRGIDPARRDRILRTLVRNLFTYHLQEIFLTLVNEYTDWTRLSTANPMNVWQSLTELLGDALVVAPTIKSGILHSKFPSRKASTYFYQFHYASEAASVGELGCPHGDDLAFVFGAPLVPGAELGFFPTNYTKAEASFAETVITLWTNFAKYGDPNGDPRSESDSVRSRTEKVHWPRYDEQEQKYLSITMKPKIKDHYHAHRLSYWLNLLPKLHVAGSSSSLEHHLLEDHDNLLTYEGIPRANQLISPKSAPGPSASFPGASLAAPAAPHHTSSPASDSLPSHGRNSTAASGGSPAPPPPSVLAPTTPVSPTTLLKSAFDGATIPSKTHDNNINASVSMMIQQGSYSTALSVTIAIGCSLLILNVLVFAGIFYRRDKNNPPNYQQNKLNTDANGQAKDSNQGSPVKLNAFIGNSLYPGDPGLTPAGLSPSAMSTPPPPHLSKGMSGHVSMVNSAFYGNEHLHGGGHPDNGKNVNKVMTVRGTVEFEGRDRHDMNI